MVRKSQTFREHAEKIGTDVGATVPAGVDGFLRMPDVETATGLRRGFIYRLIQRGDFPAPYKLTARASAWRVSEVQSWINGRPRAAVCEAA